MRGDAIVVRVATLGASGDTKPSRALELSGGVSLDGPVVPLGCP